MFIQRTITGFRSGIRHYILTTPTTECDCQMQRCEVTSSSAFIASRRLTAILTNQHGKSCRILYQLKKQTWEDLLITFGIKVSSY